ncbi:MAG: hypothetical protein SGILL_005130, partial [Bacillariaceae sp.]
AVDEQGGADPLMQSHMRCSQKRCVYRRKEVTEELGGVGPSTIPQGQTLTQSCLTYETE